MFVNLHLLETQSTLIYGRLYLSTGNITIIGGMRKKNHAPCNKHIFLVYLEEEYYESL